MELKYLIVVPTDIQWSLPKDATLHSNVSGSCTLTSNPPPAGNLDIVGCADYQSSITVIDNYTVTINFTIYNITQSCHIYCQSANYEEKKILTVSTVVTINTTDNPSLPPGNTPTTSTPISNVTSNQTTSNSTTDLPTTATLPKPTEQGVKEHATTNTTTTTTTMDSDATIKLLLILVVVGIFY